MDESPEQRPSRAYCLFLSESSPMGVALDVVAEVMEAGRLVWLPLCPRQVVGLCTYRGKIVPVVLPVPVDRPLAGVEVKTRAVLILRTGNGLWGLSIDRGGVSVEVTGEQHGTEDSGPAMPRGFVVSGSVEREGRTHAILDHDRTWRGLKTEIDRWYADALGTDGSGFLSGSGRCGDGASSKASKTRRVET